MEWHDFSFAVLSSFFLTPNTVLNILELRFHYVGTLDLRDTGHVLMTGFQSS